MITELVDRFGRTGFAAITSLIWALPMAAWAGSADLTPVDRTPYPWIALSIGLVMLAVWLVLLTRIAAMPITVRPHRLDFQAMSSTERRWDLALAAFVTGLIAWLNAAATVDWSPLAAAVRSGLIGPILFAASLLVFLAAMLVGIWLSWRRSSAAFQARRSSAHLE